MKEDRECERDKYERRMTTLSHKLARALYVGRSIGILTQMVAQRRYFNWAGMCHRTGLKCTIPGLGSLLRIRFEETAAGRAVISIGLVATLAAISVANMPVSEIRSALLGCAQPYLNATGLDIPWGVFAPNPRNGTYYVEGLIDYADHTSSVWKFPARSALAEYSDYRWQKLEEWVRVDEHRDTWHPLSQYIANEARRAGHTPTRVSLVRRWSESLPPGRGPEHGRWHEFTFYVERVG